MADDAPLNNDIDHQSYQAVFDAFWAAKDSRSSQELA